MKGEKLSALYGIWPHKLGLCGPEKKSAKEVLYQFLQGREKNQAKVRKILEGFEAAFSYYRLIARANNIEDPFDEKVVRAYWVGNDLLEKVKIANLREMIVRDFSKPGLLPKEIAKKKAREIPENALCHHSFHVLILGSVTGKVPYQLKYLDFCRIGWGRIIKISNLKSQMSKLIVKYRPLVENKVLKLGKLVEKEILWDRTITPQIKVGDWVSFHWNNLVEKLSEKDIENLEKYTKLTLKILTQGH